MSNEFFYTPTWHLKVWSFWYLQDLVAATQPDRNWKGIIIAVLVIGSVCALIVTSVVLLTPPDEGPRVKGRRLELQDIFSLDFQPYRLNGTWISGKAASRDFAYNGFLIKKKWKSLTCVPSFSFKKSKLQTTLHSLYSGCTGSCVRVCVCVLIYLLPNTWRLVVAQVASLFVLVSHFFKSLLYTMQIFPD